MSRYQELKEIPHGTNAGASQHRRRNVPMCDPCRVAKNDYMRMSRERGPVRELISAHDAMLRINELMEIGLKISEIADAAGLPRSSVTNMFNHHNTKNEKRITRENHDAIMSVSPDWARGSVVPAHTVQRRMQALMYAGWTNRDLTAVGINLSDDRLSEFYVSRAVFARWDAAYRKYGYVPGPSIKAIFKAYRNDWAPAYCWDDIDDPAALPEGRACVAWCGAEAVRRSLCPEHDLEVGECSASEYSAAVRRIRRELERGAA